MEFAIRGVERVNPRIPISSNSSLDWPAYLSSHPAKLNILPAQDRQSASTSSDLIAVLVIIGVVALN